MGYDDFVAHFFGIFGAGYNLGYKVDGYKKTDGIRNRDLAGLEGIHRD